MFNEARISSEIWNIVLFMITFWKIKFISNTQFSLHCLYWIHTQTDCHHCPHTRHLDTSVHSYQCIGETGHRRQWYGAIVIPIGSQDTILTVCCDTKGYIWFAVDRRGMASVSKSEFPGLINHHYSTSCIVSHADIQVSVLTDVFVITVPWVERLTFIIKINGDVFSYAGLAEVDMTKVTLALCYSGLTKVTPGQVLGTVIWNHCRVPKAKKKILIIKIPYGPLFLCLMWGY